jgi:hypothetical protein
MLNSEKLSKSTGKFCTLLQVIKEFSLDTTRFALADACDGIVFEPGKSPMPLKASGEGGGGIN